MACDQCTMDHNGNKLNGFSFTFCVIHGTDYVTFRSHFMDTCFTMDVLNICTFYVCVMCYVIFIQKTTTTTTTTTTIFFSLAGIEDNHKILH